MGINLANLNKEELKELFDGFNSDFLNAPLKSPTKTLKRYIPTGFRSSKVPRQLVVRMYCEAISAGEPSLCKYVAAEISKVFQGAGIDTYCETLELADVVKQTRALIELAPMLWKNGITIPAYIVLSLYGIECSDEQKYASQELNSAHFAAMDIATQDGERRGQQEAEAANRTASENADKNSKKQQKRIVSLEEQLAQRDSAYLEQQAKIDALSEELSSANESVKRVREFSDAAKKQIIALTNENKDKQEQLVSMSETLHNHVEQLAAIPQLESTIRELRAELTSAKERAYSEAVLERLCIDVIDELRASSLGDKAVLELAKKKFSEAISVENAWVEISNFSEGRIKTIIESIANSNIHPTILDEVEEIEDGILIKFAVLKALKSLIYKELEITELQRTIADRFGQVEG